MEEGLDNVLSTLELEPWEQLAKQVGFPQGIRTFVRAVAGGETPLDGGACLLALAQALFTGLSQSVQQMRVFLLAAAGYALFSLFRVKENNGADTAALLLLCVIPAFHLLSCIRAAAENVNQLSTRMQTLFPVLLTLLAAVGGSAGAAFFQPAIVAASGGMTGLVCHITLPLAAANGVITVLMGVCPRVPLGKLKALTRKLAEGTIGVGFTVFIGITVLESAGAAVTDGVSIRTAKYALDNFLPIVGGMFSDTVDVLVGCSLLIKNALGVTGFLLLTLFMLRPAMQTVGMVLLYRLCAAVLEPVAPEQLTRMTDGFADAMTLLFVIQLSCGAMYLLLLAQMLVVGNLTVMLR